MASLLAILLLLTIDQLSKALALRTLELGQTAWFYNDFAGIGISAYLNPLNSVGAKLPPEAFIALGFAAATVGVVLAFRPGRPLRRAAGVFAAAGALGNSLDRIRFGAVVDWVGPGWIWNFEIPAVANVADFYLFAAVCLLLLSRPWLPRRQTSELQSLGETR